ncbi:hypothetical protein BDM02DRAFT_3137339 [Thelephora ganbajun]|uniref:Uncharacterized protein n=1 Tax=Thelephora ganbajun TaxID=370292 RepID=A0ACB6ZSF8_THEGA|nr:hypothetical protein BDM02DRAFT_3137339 [Thelephora ganbajun]
MSRGGRGGGRGGRGGLANNIPPMGLTFADIQAMSREATENYPARELPVLTEPSEDEKRICQLQNGFVTRLRRSQYYIIEPTKTNDLERYSDRYRPSLASQPVLKRRDLNPAFFPPEIFEDYFNPRRKRKVTKATSTKKLNLDDMIDENDEASPLEQLPRKGSDSGSQLEEEDYDVDEEFDNDYAENYFDNGEGDDMDDLGDGGGGGGDLGNEHPQFFTIPDRRSEV